jgi:hypothetical protein
MHVDDMLILWCAQLHNNTPINISVCSVQIWRRAETPKWCLFSQTKSSRRREIKTERQRVSRDLAVRPVVLPGGQNVMAFDYFVYRNLKARVRLCVLMLSC